MKKTSGQALVEFVLILPIFLFILFGTIDFGKIIYEKYKLLNDLEIIKELYQQNNEIEMNQYLKKNHLNISYQQEDSYLTITIQKNISIITPGLNQILKSPYSLNESITLLNEIKS